MAHTANQTSAAPYGMMPTGIPHTAAVYTLAEGGRLASVSAWWLHQQFYKGKIKLHRIAGKLMLPANELDRLLQESVATYEPSVGIGAIAAKCARERAAKRRRASKRKAN